MQRVLAAMLGSGALLAHAAMLLPHWPEVNAAAIAVLAAPGYPMAAVLVLTHGRLPRWLLHVLLQSATVLVTIGVHFGHHGSAAAATPILYVWVSLYAFYFFPRRVAMVHVGLVAVAYAAVLAIERDHAAPSQWLFVMGTVVVAGAIVGSLAREVRALARVDPVTGVANRRAWEEALPRELGRADRGGTPLCIAIIDLDSFKALNDASGHQEGDRILVALARAWAEDVRGSDLLTRYGGDEFAALLPDCVSSRAEEILARFRLRTATLVEFSAGVAQWDGHESAPALVGRADAVLYEAKRAGGGRTVVACEHHQP